MEELTLFLFQTTALFSMIFLINLQNIVHSVFLLILVFANVGAVLILLQIEFLALVYIIVYLGAIAVLFLFAVMMLNIKLSPASNKIYDYAPLHIVIAFIIATELAYVLTCSFSELFFDEPSYIIFISLINNQPMAQLGLVLFLFLTTPFLIVGLILLVALLGVIILTLNDTDDVKHQEITKQLKASHISIRSGHPYYGRDHRSP
jgi:NADH-quinone oxidoreductase subunit J